MLDFLLSLFVVSLWCFGFRQLFQEGMILEKVGDWLWSNLPEYLCKPLFQCPYCMASIHGSIGFILLFDFFVLKWVAFVVCLCGLNYLLTKAILEPKDVTNHY